MPKNSLKYSTPPENNLKYSTPKVLDALGKIGLYDYANKKPQGVMFWVRSKKQNEPSLKIALDIIANGSQPDSLYVVPARVRKFHEMVGSDATYRGYKRDQETLADAEWLAIIAEHDDCSKEESLQIVANSSLPPPTFQIDSGNKSIHHWWLLQNPISQYEFVSAQTRLAQLLNSDPTINKPTQIIRLPGVINHKTGKMCEFIHIEEDLFGLPVKYDYAELEALLPKLIERKPIERKVIERKPIELTPPIQATEAAVTVAAPVLNTDQAKKSRVNDSPVQTKRKAHAWFDLLSVAGQDEAAAEILGHVWEQTAGDYPESHETRRAMVAGMVGHYRSPDKVRQLWEAAARERGLSWDKTTKPNILHWATELLQGQNKRDNGSSHHPSKNSIGTCIALAYKFGWNSVRFKRMLAENSDHLQKMVCGELFDGGEGWITFTGKCYRKVETHYEYVDDVALESQISGYLADTEEYASKANAANTEGVLKWLKLRTGTTARPNPDGYINCTNGVLQVKAGGYRRLIPHEDPESEEFIFFDAPKFAYDPEADRAQAHRLLECLPDAQGRALFMRAMAFAINWEEAARRHGHSIAVFSRGEGSNGKDTNIVILKRIFGESAVTGVQLTEFQKADKGSSFALCEFAHARLNLPSETNCQLKIDNLKALKATTSGNSIWVEKKGIQGFMMTPKITQMYPTNNEFILNNAREADERRYMALDWPFSYTTNEQKITLYPDKFKLADRRFLGLGLDDEWLCQKVVPGYFNILLDYYEEVCKHGFDDLLDYSRSVLKKMGEKINHVRTFINDIGLCSEPGIPAYHENSISLTDMFNLHYKSWCLDNGRAETIGDHNYAGAECKLLSPNQTSDRTCMTPVDLEHRLADLTYSVGRPNQQVAERCGLKRGRYLRHCKLISVD
jgi:phage/plasmid-associated DNA primase